MKFHVENSQKVYIHDMLKRSESTDKELTIFVKQGVVLNLLVVVEAKDDSRFKMKLRIVHEEDDASSNVRMHCIARDSAEIALWGAIDVAENTQGMQVSLTQKGLLLSSDAKITFDPVLEIDDFRLTGSHAATISSPLPEHIYYLCSRGMNKAQAEEIIAEGLLHIPADYTKIEENKFE